MQLPNRPWNDPQRFCLSATPCPYYNKAASRCGASFSGMPVKRARRKLYCQSDDHDSCPLYLCHMLRHSQSRDAGLTRQEFICK